MHSRFVPESESKHKAKMESCDARKGAASRGVLEVFDTTMLMACCLQRASGLAGGSGEKSDPHCLFAANPHSDLHCLFAANPPQRVLSHWDDTHCKPGEGI